MIGVTLLTFGLFRVIPGDAVILRCGFGCSPEVLENLRHRAGLDKPGMPISIGFDYQVVPTSLHFNRHSQYGDWILDVSHGDFGRSLSEGELAVGPQLNHRLPITIELGIMTIIFALLLGVPVGIYSAIRPGTPLDWLARFTSVVWLSVPSFYLAILIIDFGLQWFGWAPPQFSNKTFVPFFDDPLTNLEEFFFPALVLAVGIAAFLMRLTRSAMLEVMRNDYIRTAWAKGLRERAVVWRHALKNALIPLTTVLGLQVGALLGGAVIIESVFNLNGVGKYALEAIIRRDIPVVQTLTLLFALAHVTANLSVDVAYAWLDPRIHYN